jgi:hypothetical protein
VAPTEWKRQGFPILSAAALSCVERERVGYAASLFNMLHQQSRAVGIAYMANMLIRNQQIHTSGRKMQRPSSSPISHQFVGGVEHT